MGTGAAAGRPRDGPAEDGEAVLLDAGARGTVGLSAVPGHIGTVVSITALRHNKGNDATVGIWRVRGSEGSAVLKISGPPTGGYAGYWPTADDPAHWNYWRREALAYATGLATSAYADAGITAPRMLKVTERLDGLVELWLDDVSGAEGFEMPVPRLARFAYELGAGQARWVGRVPGTGWLSRRWLRQYLAAGPARSVRLDDSGWDHPGVAAWPLEVRRELRRLWSVRYRLLTVAEGLERTLCHLDVWPANLIDAHGATVLLDWSFAGEGAVGEDLANLVLDSFTDGLMDPALLPDVVDSATTRYLGGLRDGGWSGSDDAVRTAIAVCGSVKYSWLAPAVLGRVVRDDLGTSSYSSDDSTGAQLQRLAGPVSLIADWARAVPV